jgi:Ca-activated chloride channel family protein
VRFGSPIYLNLLYLVPIMYCLHIYAGIRRRQAMGRLGDPGQIAKLSRSLNRKRRGQRLFLLLFGVAFIVMAMARPQYGTKLRMVERKGVDIVVALDVSQSMLAEDVKPNRLVRAKNEISSLIDKLSGDRIGIVAFAGDAFVQCPITLDYSAAKMLLDATDIQSVPEPGTAIGRAIQVATGAFPGEGSREKGLILVTDGEDLVSDPVESAKAAAKEGVKIYCIGVGSSSGAPIPMRDSNGNLIEYKKERGGESVMSRLDDRTLEAIAAITDGAYYPSTPGQVELDAVMKDIDRMEKTSFGSRDFSDYEERFQYFLLPGLLAIMLQAFLSERKREKIGEERFA